MLTSLGEIPHPPRAVAQFGRAPVSKTGGWGFESLLPCWSPQEALWCHEPTNEAQMQRQGQLAEDGTPAVRTPRRRQPRAQPRQAHASARRRSQFFRDVRAELRKVAWPTRTEVINLSIVVLVTLILLISLIFVLDLAFAKAVLYLFKT